MDNMFGRTEQQNLAAGASPMAAGSDRGGLTSKNNAALRRELWRDNPQQSVNEDNVRSSFRFDSQERERYFSGEALMPSAAAGQHAALAAGHQGLLAVNHEEQEQDIFSPGRSPHSSMSSPQVSVDSPRICFSPLRIKVHFAISKSHFSQNSHFQSLIFHKIHIFQHQILDNFWIKSRFLP